jgi:glycosyltransferase involved in cell wall biosynthesis
LSQSIVFTSNTAWFLFNFRKKTIVSLVCKGHRVICIAPEDSYARRIVSELGAEFMAIPMDGKSVSLLKESACVSALYHLIKRLQPTIVFNSTIKMNVYGGLCCWLLGVPFANNISGLGTAFIHDSWLFRRVRQVYGMVNRRALHLFFENDEDLEVFRSSGMLGNTPYTLLPGSGVDLQYFSPSRLPASDNVTFLMIARLLGDKGVREYAAAASALRKQGVNARCLLLGQLGVSNRTAITEEEVDAWQSKGSIEYLGETDDVRPFIRQAHALVLPSYREGMPRTVLEAAAMGRPAIVTDVPGCRHAIEPGVTGWLCEVRSAESLAAQMQRFVEMDPADRQAAGDAARRRMEAHFSEDVVVRAYLDCLENMSRFPARSAG